MKRLNKKAILELADMLIANKNRYNQNEFGQVTECGTFCCLAGFCYLADIGIRKFNKQVKQGGWQISFMNACETSGIKKLNLDWVVSDNSSPEIFSYLGMWPNDLQEEYRSNGPQHRVITALKALSRLRVDGSIDPDPKAVHTKIPQLKLLLDTEAKKKKG